MEKSHHGGRKETAPPHKGGGMPYFDRDHWERKVDDIEVGGGRYASEMNTEAEYKRSVDKLASYVKGHRAEH